MRPYFLQGLLLVLSGLVTFTSISAHEICERIFSFEQNNSGTSKKEFLSASQKKYVNLSLMVEDLEANKISSYQLPGRTIAIPKGLGLRSSLKKGRIVHLKAQRESSTAPPKGVVFFVGGLFYSAEKTLTKTDFINSFLEKGLDFVYLETSQGYTMAQEILNNDGQVPYEIPHEEQQTLIAYYLLGLIEKNNWSEEVPKSLMSHSYGGWLGNEFLSNPEYNGSSTPNNKFLQKKLEGLKSKGLIGTSSFRGVIQSFIPLDSGLASLHFGHPSLVDIGQNYEINKELKDEYLARSMKAHYLQKFPELEEDPYIIDNNIALYLGIRRQNSLKAPEEIPQEINVFDIVAGSSELIPSSWHRHYFQSLKRSALSPQQRFSLVLEQLPHDFLSIPEASQLLAELVLGEFSPENYYNILSLGGKEKERQMRSLSVYPGNMMTDYLEINLNAQQVFWEQLLRYANPF